MNQQIHVRIVLLWFNCEVPASDKFGNHDIIPILYTNITIQKVSHFGELEARTETYSRTAVIVNHEMQKWSSELPSPIYNTTLPSRDLSMFMQRHELFLVRLFYACVKLTPSDAVGIWSNSRPSIP